MSSGILNSSGVFDIANVGYSYKCTLSLSSSDAGRKIELSVNNGEDYSVPQYDVEEDGVLGVAVLAPITNVRFTGAEGDKWEMLP